MTQTDTRTAGARFMDWLRGDAKSIRARFYRQPLEWLDLFWSTKIKGESYTEWYRRRMNRMAVKSTAANRPVNPAYLDNAARQVNYLKHRGLKPDHDFLEYGCGILRVGLHLMKYMEDGRYVAADISDNRVQKGVGILKENGIDPSRYRAVVLTNEEAKELGDQRFDFIIAHDVFPHMPTNECTVCLKTLSRHLKPEGQLFVTFSMADAAHATNAKDYWVTRSEVHAMAEKAGLSVSEETDWEQYRLEVQPDQSMFRFVLPN